MMKSNKSKNRRTLSPTEIIIKHLNTMFAILTIGLCGHIYLLHAGLEVTQQSLYETQENLIHSQENHIKHLKSTFSLAKRVNELESQIDKYKDMESIEHKLPNNADLIRKTYMDYRHITDRSSKQWKLQQRARTNEDGIRALDGIPMVAFGKAYADVGDYMYVELDSGKSFVALNADQKAVSDTDSGNTYSLNDKDIIEFIVDESKLDAEVKQHGDMSQAGYEGAIIRIQNIGIEKIIEKEQMRERK